MRLKACRRSLALIGAFLFASTAAAQTASLVKDILPPGAAGVSVSKPTNFFVAAGKVFFIDKEPSSGREVWVTDGTANGTQLLLANVCPGACYQEIKFLGAAGRLVYWVTSEDGLEPWLLWRSDGTPAGTFALAGTQGNFSVSLPGIQSAGAGPIAAAVGWRLAFVACRSFRCGLWSTDGTVAGTGEVHAPAETDGYADELTAWKGKVYFFDAAGEGAVLWASDGTAAGTVKIIDVPVDHPGFQNHFLTALPDRLVFTAAVDGDEVWASDGTPAGTAPITHFDLPSPFGVTLGFAVLGGRVYFVADDVIHGSEIWASDGTPAGTHRVTDIGFHAPFGGAQPLMGLAGSRLVFVATDGIHPSQLWTTDGRPESTIPLAALPPLAGTDFVQVGGKLVFAANAEGLGAEIWATDGTPPGTGPLADLCPGACSSVLLPPVPFLGKALFVAQDSGITDLWTTDGSPAGTRRFTHTGKVDGGAPVEVAVSGATVFFGADAADGVELWKSDGTNAGTRQVASIGVPQPSANPANLTAVGGRIVFCTCNGAAPGIWQSLGTEESTQPVVGTLPAVTCGDTLLPRSPFAVAGGAAFFTLRGDLWRSDGTGAGTRVLDHFAPSDVVSELVSARNRVFFLVRSAAGTGAGSLWASDGTPAGTAKAFDMPDVLSFAAGLTAIGDDLYFSGAGPGDENQSLWRSDGTAAGTVQLFEVNDTYGFYTTFVGAGARVFILLVGGASGSQLWTTDGTPAGSALVGSFANFPGQQGGSEAGALGGAIYFFEESGLWRSDGTAGGTRFVFPFQIDLDPRNQALPSEFTVVGDHLYFVADDEVHGRQLWRTDGTASGTAMVRIFVPGTVSTLTAAGNRLYFSADDGGHGFELWESDGTAEGTRLVQDIAPGAASSYPAELTVAGGRLYFVADDGLHGRELWSVALPGTAGATGCRPSAGRLCLNAGRFAVEATWRDFDGNAGIGTAVPLTPDTGYFWFFNPANVEVMTKVLDGRGVNQAFWVFYGALSTVGYTLTVTDTQTGLTRRYENLQGQLASVGDTDGFGPHGAFDLARDVALPRAAAGSPANLVSARTDPRAATGSCAAGSGTLCLSGGRFSVTAAWKDFQGHTGRGTAVSLTADTGYFWFFDAANVEVVTKVLDGRAVNSKFWLFYGALSSVEYTLTVTDTQTGAVKMYKNPSGTLGSLADTGAF